MCDMLIPKIGKNILLKKKMNHFSQENYKWSISSLQQFWLIRNDYDTKIIQSTDYLNPVPFASVVFPIVGLVVVEVVFVAVLVVVLEVVVLFDNVEELEVMDFVVVVVVVGLGC